MIKKTLYFGNPTYLSTQNNQLMIKKPDLEKEGEYITKPIAIEDVGFCILDHNQITISKVAMQKLLENNVAFMICNDSHLPISMQLPLAANDIQTERFRYQIDASMPLKKQLWQQTVKSKIINQANHLSKRNQANHRLLHLAKSVSSGDAENCEATAANFYWRHIFIDKVEQFNRQRDGNSPNDLLNYGYAVLRAVVARSLCISGLLPTLGIFHRNKYNAYCLADDIMEPYRPYVDEVVYTIMEKEKPGDWGLANIGVRAALLRIPSIDVNIDGKTRPLMNAVQRTTASLFRCFEGAQRKILYPVLE